MLELKKHRRNIPDKELIRDVMDVAVKSGKKSITMEYYDRNGKFSSSALVRRFDSWFKVLEKPNLESSRSPLNIPNEDLLKNLGAGIDKEFSL